MGQKLTVSAREMSPMDDAGFFSVVLSYKMALVSPTRTEHLLSFGVRPPIKPSLSGAWSGVRAAP